MRYRNFFTVTLTNGETMEGCRTAAVEAVTDYLRTLTLESDEGTSIIVRMSVIGAMISALPQVLDYEELLINGGNDKYYNRSAEVPCFKEVCIRVAD